jgi:hypothetical protein
LLCVPLCAIFPDEARCKPVRQGSYNDLARGKQEACKGVAMLLDEVLAAIMLDEKGFRVVGRAGGDRRSGSDRRVARRVATCARCEAPATTFTWQGVRLCESCFNATGGE